MIRGRGPWLMALGLLLTSHAAYAEEPAAPPPAAAATSTAAPAAAADIKLDLVLGEVKMLALEDVKAWSLLPEAGLSARAVDEGHTLRLVAIKDGVYTLKLDRKDGSVTTYAVHVGTPPVVGPPIAPIAPVAPVDLAGPKISGNGADAKYKRNTLDLDLQGGIGRHLGEPNKTLGFGRARVGVMFARWPMFTMLGATYEVNTLSPATFGVQAELLHLSAGVWGEVGAMLDTHGKAGGMASLGFSVLGVEAQYRGYEDTGYGVTLIGKLRIPVGVILYALDVNKKKE